MSLQGVIGATADRPLVSVVMPAYNAAPYVEQAVRCALDQAGAEVELLFVDDGSTDTTAEIVQRLQAEYGPRLTLLRGARGGPYPARNRALQAARGEFVAFLDADDWWEPDFVTTLLQALQASGADIAYCGWRNVGEGISGGRAEPYVPPAYEDGDPVEHFLRGCPWPIHGALLRRQVVDAVGGFSERLFSSMDYDLWIRLLAVTRNMVRVPRVLAYYRWHGSGQISAVKWRQVLHAWQVRRDFVAANPALVAHLGAARRRELVDGPLLEQGRTLFWRRDLEGARHLLRRALATGAWRAADLPLLAAAQLPLPVFAALVRRADSRSRP
ncbi:glycosyltransferase family 2 protein [Rubrivivax gelatinosus]|nr:glycosyltransferase [Rubrivivax gelatinosus]